jgi:predicted metal-dependent hydrolase
MPQKYYLHPAFGEITLKKIKQSKGLRIIIRSSNSITVTFPLSLTYNDAIRFVDEKTDWINQSLKKIEEVVKKKLFLPDSEFKTFAHVLLFEKIALGSPYIKVDRYKITVFYDKEPALYLDEVQMLIQKAIEKVLRNEALNYLPPRVNFYAEKHRLLYKNISVKKMKTRWGSCSSSGNLNFNIHLMRLPIHLIDYVILHELAHLKHHNHGPHFWKFLDELSGNAKEKSHEMKKFRTTL